MRSCSGAVRRLAWWDPDKKSVCNNKFDRSAAAESDAGKANTLEAAKFGRTNHGFSSENTLNVLARALLLIAFRARLEFINASRHAFKNSKNVSSGLEQMDNSWIIHLCACAVYK